MGKWMGWMGVACALVLGAAARGSSVIVSTLDGAGHYSKASAYHISNGLSNADQFTAPASFQLDAIQLGIAARFSASEHMKISLYGDVGGVPSGSAALESWTIQNLPLAPDGVGVTGFPLTTLTSVLHPSLMKGTAYWIALSTTDPGNLTEMYWYLAGNGAIGRAAAMGGGYPPGWNGYDFQQLAAFSVIGTIPLPGSAAGGAVLAAGMMLRRRERNRGR